MNSAQKKRKLTAEEAAECAALKAIYVKKKKALGLTQDELGERLGGIGQSGVSHYLNGVNALNVDVAAGFARELEVAVADFSPRLAAEIAKIARSAAEPAKKIESNVEPCPPIKGPWRAIPIVGTAQMGIEGYWYQLDTADGYIEFPSTDRDAYALRLKGDSMAPAIKSGWIAVCEPNHRLVTLEYVMIRLNDGESMVKELLRATDEEVTVQSVNDAYGRRTIPIEEIETIHYVSAIVAPSKVIG